MDDDRRIELALTVKAPDGTALVPEPIEQVRAGLALLAKGLDVADGYSFRDLLQFPDEASPALLAHAGLFLLLTSLGGLDRDTKVELMTFAVKQVKAFLPVLVQWDLFDPDGKVIGRTTQRLSQREAEQRFGLGEV